MVMGTILAGSLTSAYAYYKERMYGYKGYVQNELIPVTCADYGDDEFIEDFNMLDITCTTVKIDKSRKRFYLSNCY
jgi:hypothetical protein